LDSSGISLKIQSLVDLVRVFKKTNSNIIGWLFFKNVTRTCSYRYQLELTRLWYGKFKLNAFEVFSIFFLLGRIFWWLNLPFKLNKWKYQLKSIN
jgi:hypothetical protein